MSQNYRMFPPVEVGLQTRVVNGRQYSAQPGSVVTPVPEWDAGILFANKWTGVLTGPTSSRPTSTSVPQPAQAGLRFFDETLGYEILCSDDLTWKNPATGLRSDDAPRLLPHRKR
jgi:hypothetical protein